MSGSWRVVAVLPLLGFTIAASPAEISGENAVSALEAAPCGASTIGERLAQETRSHSRRDLGWRSFPAGGHTDWERALRISKSMDLRYRWRVSPTGTVEAVSDAALALCQPH